MLRVFPILYSLEETLKEIHDWYAMMKEKYPNIIIVSSRLIGEMELENELPHVNTSWDIYKQKTHPTHIEIEYIY